MGKHRKRLGQAILEMSILLCLLTIIAVLFVSTGNLSVCLYITRYCALRDISVAYDELPAISVRHRIFCIQSGSSRQTC